MAYICRNGEITKIEIKIKSKAKIVQAFCLIFLFTLSIIPALVLAADGDDDNDGLTNDQEAAYYSDPQNPDTDGDGYMDGVEVASGYSPIKGGGAKISDSDYDGDGLDDWLEGWFGSDRGKKDTDGDGFSDYDEVYFGYSPIDPSPVKKFKPEIVVDKTTQHLSIMIGGVKVASFPVSTGNPATETPNGQFSVLRKVPVKHYSGTGYDLPGVKWNMEFRSGYYIHTAYWHNDFGIRTRSHGCVNMHEADAEKMYKYFSVGTPVSVVGETPKKFFVGT